MRKILFMLFILSCFTAYPARTPVAATALNPVTTSVFSSVSPESLSKMSVKDFERLTGRKLRLKEKIAYKIVQSKLKKELRQKTKGEYSKRSKTAFILSILSLATIVLIPLSVVLAVISIILASKSLKFNDEDRKAKTALGLSILSLGIIVVGLLIWGIFISDGAFKLFIIN